MELNAHAKLNLLLNVESKQFNGYHNLETIMIPLGLHDTIIANRVIGNSKIFISTNNSQLPTDERNVLYRCAELMKRKYSLTDGIEIYLDKKIPISSGLGGESTDAAALIRFYNEEYNLNMSYSDVFYYGRLLGWDVPICYFNKCIYISDNKSINEFVNVKTEYYVLLVKPHYGILTKDAFVQIDKIENTSVAPDNLIDSLLTGANIGAHLHNCFIKTDNRLMLDYQTLQYFSKSIGFDGVSMSGTGSCFFLVTKDFNIAVNGYNELKSKYSYVNLTKTLK